MDETTPLITCESCGVTFGIGCSPFCRDRHAPVRGSAGFLEFVVPFSNYFDEGLGVDITGRDHRRRVMRDLHCDHRELPTKGDKSARRDKIEQRKREARQ